jgi:hypothetical protein
MSSAEQAEGVGRYVPKKPPVGAGQDAEHPPEDRPDKVRQTLHLPSAVHDQLRDLAHRNRRSQQKLIKKALNMLFAANHLPSWEQLAPPPKRGGK